MPRTEKQLQEIREKSKEKIMDAAFKLFVKHGFHGTSISKIAKEAGIATGLMYNYFKSKDELLHEIIMHNVKDLAAVFMAHVDDICTKDGIISFFDDLFAVTDKKKNLLRLQFSILLQRDTNPMNSKHGNHFTMKIAEMIERYFNAQNVANAKEKSSLVASLIHGAFLNYIITEDKKEFIALKNEFIRIYFS